VALGVVAIQEAVLDLGPERGLAARGVGHASGARDRVGADRILVDQRRRRMHEGESSKHHEHDEREEEDAQVEYHDEHDAAEAIRE